VVEVAVRTLEANPESSDHSSEYGVAARPAPLSTAAVHVHDGVLLLVGEVVVGVPGVVGAAVSITIALFAASPVTGIKFVIGTPPVSSIVPAMETRSRSEEVSPACTM
jgi:hypothetical protein